MKGLGLTSSQFYNNWDVSCSFYCSSLTVQAEKEVFNSEDRFSRISSWKKKEEYLMVYDRSGHIHHHNNACLSVCR